jgi:hypothetical protein
VAQSIGLHVEDSLKQPVSGLAVLEQETIRRTWYSMYVLDRLLALQLGRPVAIHEEDYFVNLPSETDGTACLFDGDTTRCPPESKSSPLDYFLSVINFSQILGQVIRDLYRPSQVAIDPDRMLSSIAALDGRLREWKLYLPRHLRFDLGHTFEKSMTFKRQVRLSFTSFVHSLSFAAKHARHKVPPPSHSHASSLPLSSMVATTQSAIDGSAGTRP